VGFICGRDNNSTSDEKDLKNTGEQQRNYNGNKNRDENPKIEQKNIDTTKHKEVVQEQTKIQNGNLKKVNSFPEEYIGNKIIFKNIKYWPTLVSFSNYYTVQLGLISEDGQWCFQTLDKIIGVVGKKIAKQMIDEGIGGYGKFYYGTVEGEVIKSGEIFGSHYIFIVTKIINHYPDDFANPIKIYK
jgi:hypothetical protein